MNPRKAFIVASLFLVAFAFGTAYAGDTIPGGLPVWIGPLVLAVVQWIAAWLVKRNPTAVNQGIGWLTLLLSAFGYAIVPKEANAASFFASVLGPVRALGYPLAVVLQTAIVTGLHEWIRGAILEPLQGKRSTSTTYSHTP